MKFAMGSETLSTLKKETTGEHDQLGALVLELFQSAEVLEPVFQGAAKITFDNFKANVDQIAVNLDGALAAVLGSVAQQDLAFTTGESEMTDQVRSIESAQNYSSANFA